VSSQHGSLHWDDSLKRSEKVTSLLLTPRVACQSHIIAQEDKQSYPEEYEEY
jgi:hypothetical protein